LKFQPASTAGSESSTHDCNRSSVVISLV
jgi:hypothetical protein